VVIEHDSGFAAGFQNSPGLAKTLCGVGTVVQDAVGVDDIEGLVRERKVLGVGQLQIRF